VAREDYMKLKEEKRVLQCVSFEVICWITILTPLLCRDGAYVQFIRARGPLEQNLRAQLKA
jgi:large subunit ribosomal protein L10e